MIDHIFAPKVVLQKQAKIIDLSPLESEVNQIISDHYPVVAEVQIPEVMPSQRERLAALDTFDQDFEELTEAEWRIFDEAASRHPWFSGRQLDL